MKYTVNIWLSPFLEFLCASGGLEAGLTWRLQRLLPSRLQLFSRCSSSLAYNMYTHLCWRNWRPWKNYIGNCPLLVKFYKLTFLAKGYAISKVWACCTSGSLAAAKGRRGGSKAGLPTQGGPEPPYAPGIRLSFIFVSSLDRHCSTGEVLIPF